MRSNEHTTYKIQSDGVFFETMVKVLKVSWRQLSLDRQEKILFTDYPNLSIVLM